jgi:hypothetical protein
MNLVAPDYSFGHYRCDSKSRRRGKKRGRSDMSAIPGEVFK